MDAASILTAPLANQAPVNELEKTVEDSENAWVPAPARRPKEALGFSLATGGVNQQTEVPSVCL